MKGFVVKIIATVLFVGLVLFGIGLYLYEVLVKNTSPTENLLRLVILSASGVLGLTKLYGGQKKRRRRSLEYYEGQYTKELKNTFVEDPASKKSLLKAIRLYNENKFISAVRILKSLRSKCASSRDSYAVELFIALSYTDMGALKSAADSYEKMISRGLKSYTVYGNLGNLYSALGMNDKATEVLKLGIDAYPDSDLIYNNLAQIEFEDWDFESAKAHAHAAAEINSKNRAAASLLAVIYFIEGNTEEEEKYTQIAIKAGHSAANIQYAKENYAKVMSDRP